MNRAALLCYHDDGVGVSVEWTYWLDRAEARRARDELAPCGAECIGVHSVVGIDPATRPAPTPRHLQRCQP